MSKTRRGERTEEGTSQEAGEAEALSMAAVLTILREERQAEREEWQAERQEQHVQQQTMMALLEQQREELARYREQMATMAAEKEAGEGETPRVKVKLPKPTLQKLTLVMTSNTSSVRLSELPNRRGGQKRCGLPSWRVC